MKRFDRFDHHGVLTDLNRIKSQFVALDGIEVGSSGSGEITLRSPVVTAYVRKYRNKDGWRVVFCRSGKDEEKHCPATEQDVISLLKKHFS
jgi:hypothetical protein